MKTLFTNSISKLMLALVLSSAMLYIPVSVSAAPKSPVRIDKEAKNFKKIIVTGNVEITLTQDTKESILYSDENSGRAYVTQQGETLRIRSTNHETVRLNISIQDIYRIDASDAVVIKTENQLNLKYLQIILKGNAKADINSNTQSLYTVLNENSNLKLSGTTNNHAIVMSKSPTLTLDKLNARNTIIDSSRYMAKL